MNNHPIAFFFCDSNNMFSAQQGSCLLSHTLMSPRDDKRGDIKGNGIFMYEEHIDNIRRSISLFCVRSLPKHTWVNSNNVFLSRRSENE
jgi:hypothetical protein